MNWKFGDKIKTIQDCFDYSQGTFNEKVMEAYALSIKQPKLMSKDKSDIDEEHQEGQEKVQQS
jgi:hypothetical protein